MIRRGIYKGIYCIVHKREGTEKGYATAWVDEHKIHNKEYATVTIQGFIVIAPDQLTQWSE